MPSVSMNRLMDNARVRLPGAVDGTILAELFSVVKDFCAATNIWRQTFEIDVIAVSTNPDENPDDFIYPLHPPTGAKVVRILGSRNANNSVIEAQLVEPDMFFLSRSPNEDQVYRVIGVLTVTDPVTRTGEPMAPDWLIEGYNDVLLDGVLARMMSQAAKPYSSPAIGALHYGMYRNGVATARGQSDRGNVYGSQGWRFPQNYSTGRNRGR